MNHLIDTNNAVSLKEAEKFFDDEEERYNVKMIIKDFMIPPKKSINNYNWKMFGMRPEEYEKDKKYKKNKKKRKSAINFGGSQKHTQK